MMIAQPAMEENPMRTLAMATALAFAGIAATAQSSTAMNASLGISQSAWEEAQLAMGREAAAVVTAAMLQKAGTINSAVGTCEI
jgi:hypothetical protein